MNIVNSQDTMTRLCELSEVNKSYAGWLAEVIPFEENIEYYFEIAITLLITDMTLKGGREGHVYILICPLTEKLLGKASMHHAICIITLHVPTHIYAIPPTLSAQVYRI